MQRQEHAAAAKDLTDDQLSNAVITASDQLKVLRHEAFERELPVIEYMFDKSGVMLLPSEVDGIRDARQHDVAGS